MDSIVYFTIKTGRQKKSFDEDIDWSACRQHAWWCNDFQF